MGAKRYSVLLFALILVPSAYLAWTWRDMPHLGLHYDDTLYLVGAKSLAEGQGYRIQSVPGQPFQTKYPPVLSALLAPVWKFGPSFPQNLPLLTLFAWLMFLACLFFMRATFRRFGFGAGETWLLTFVAAVHPVVLLLGISLMSDLLSLAIFLACLLVAERALQPTKGDPTEGAWLALAAGALGGLAYLTRTSALPLALTAPLCFLLRRRYSRALLFFAGMLPALLGWQFWTSAHMLRTSDPALMFYTNYLGMEMATVHLDNLGAVLWHNLDGLLRGIAKLIVFDAMPTNAHFQQLIGIAAIAGTVRLMRRTRRIQYPAAAAGFALLLSIYFFPSDERILLPVYPLLLMGFWTEAKNLCSVVRAVEDAGIAEINFQLGGPRQGALNQRLRQRIFDVLLQRAAQRTRAIAAVARRSSRGCTWRFRRQADLHLLGHQVHVHLLHHQVDDLDQVVVGERAEQNHFVQAIEEFRIERLLHLGAHHVFDLR
jgi:hypothetical protein